jgi:hypothetical protein
VSLNRVANYLGSWNLIRKELELRWFRREEPRCRATPRAFWGRLSLNGCDLRLRLEGDEGCVLASALGPRLDCLPAAPVVPRSLVDGAVPRVAVAFRCIYMYALPLRCVPTSVRDNLFRICPNLGQHPPFSSKMRTFFQKSATMVALLLQFLVQPSWPIFEMHL